MRDASVGSNIYRYIEQEEILFSIPIQVKKS